MWNSLILGALLRGEKALSWQSPGGALTAFELGNGTLLVPFPDRARFPPREKLSSVSETEGVALL